MDIYFINIYILRVGENVRVRYGTVGVDKARILGRRLKNIVDDQ